MQMDWTTELGQAFTADQGAVLDAVQRLRAQAKDVGNLESSPQLKVETESQDGKEIITVEPPSPEVVYVPKYDPTAVYAPPPATIPPPTTINVTGAPARRRRSRRPARTTTVASERRRRRPRRKGTAPARSSRRACSHSARASSSTKSSTTTMTGTTTARTTTTAACTTVARPYYPPPPYMYRPPYGNGYNPAHNYNRPANYQHGFNNNTIVVNNGGNNYWNNQNRKAVNQPLTPGQQPDHGREAATQRPERPQPPGRRTSAGVTGQPDQRAKCLAVDPASRQSGYAGARPENQAARERMVAKSPPAGVAKDLPTRPKTEYKGAKDRPAVQQAVGRRSAQRPRSQPPRSAGDPRARRNAFGRQRPTAGARQPRRRTRDARSSARLPAERRTCPSRSRRRQAHGIGIRFAAAVPRLARARAQGQPAGTQQHGRRRRQQARASRGTRRTAMNAKHDRIDSSWRGRVRCSAHRCPRACRLREEIGPRGLRLRRRRSVCADRGGPQVATLARLSELFGPGSERSSVLRRRGSRPRPHANDFIAHVRSETRARARRRGRFTLQVGNGRLALPGSDRAARRKVVLSMAPRARTRSSTAASAATSSARSRFAAVTSRRSTSTRRPTTMAKARASSRTSS